MFKKTYWFIISSIILFIISIGVSIFYFPTNYATQDASVNIIYPDAFGSGVILKSTQFYSYIITNNHICSLGRIPKITVMKKINITGDILKVSERYDLCLIKINVGMLPYVKLAKKYTMGQLVYNIGCGGGFCFHKTDGYIGDKIIMRDIDTLQVSTLVYPGASGSGIFNKDDELVGLVSMAIQYAPSLAFAIPLESILDFTKEFDINE